MYSCSVAFIVTENIFYFNKTMVKRKKNAKKFSIFVTPVCYTEKKISSHKIGLCLSARLFL